MADQPGRSDTKLVLGQSPHLCREDWGEAVDVSVFYGREQELAGLEQWIDVERCRLVAILGLGGIGKTSLAVRLAQQLQPRFDYLFWRDLTNAPAVDDVLAACLKFVSDQQIIDLPADTDERLTLLIDYLRQQRCLLVLDNIEAILREGERAGQYRAGYEMYGRFIRRIGETAHMSCLVLASREKPREIAALEGQSALVRSWQLAGLGISECQEIMADKGLLGPNEYWPALIEHYGGSPLVLKIVAATIQELFGGDVAAFWSQGSKVVGDLAALLDQQFSRLSRLEQEVLYWLAIEREAVPLSSMQADSVLPHSQEDLQGACESLCRRSLIERTGSPVHFSLQPVVMEYITGRLIAEVCREVSTGEYHVLNSHALVKAQAKDYIRVSQAHLILDPIVGRLLAALGQRGLEERLQTLVSTARDEFPRQPGYLGGNVATLLVHARGNLNDCDLSHLAVWEAYLRGVEMRRASLAHADMARSVFTETFGNILCTAFSPSGQLFAAGGSKGELHVWRMADGMRVFASQGHRDWIRTIAFSPDGTLLATGSSDQSARLWDVASGTTIKVLPHPDRVRAVAFSPDGLTLASGCQDQLVRLWDVETGLCRSILDGHQGRVGALAFHPYQAILASGSEDHSVCLWDVEHKQLLRMLEHPVGVYSIAFSPDGLALATGGGDQEVRLWDVRTGKQVQSLVGHAWEICSVAFSPDGSLLASGSVDQTIRIWSLPSGECRRTLMRHRHRIESVSFSPDGQLLASGGGGDQTVRFWDVKTGQCIESLQGFLSWMLSLAYSPDGRILASGDSGGAVRVWNSRTSSLERVLAAHAGHSVRTVAFSLDGDLLASAGGDGIVRIWEVRSGECRNSLRGHDGRIRSIDFQPGSSILASGSEDQTIILWDARTGERIKTLEGHAGRIYAVTFRTDGCVLASAAEDQTVRLWDVSSGECLRILRGHTNWVWAAAYSPDGDRIASCGDDRRILLWDASSGEIVDTFEYANRLWAVAFSPDGRLIASGSSDGTVQLWDTRTRQLQVLPGHSYAVLAIAFSPNRRTLASASDDGTIRLWNVRTGKCVNVLRGDLPYEQLDITDATGLTAAQKASLKALGAIERTGHSEPAAHGKRSAAAKSVSPEANNNRGIYYNAKTNRVLRNGEVMGLSEEQKALVRFLCSRPGAVCTKDQIVDAVWPEDKGDVPDSNIYELVKRVRQKLEPNWRDPIYIVTVPGEGYCLQTPEEPFD